MTTNCYSHCLLPTPIGQVGVIASGNGLVEVMIGRSLEELAQAINRKYPTSMTLGDSAAVKACLQLAEYFNGQRRVFDLRIDFSHRRDFTLSILQELARVPFGETLTYGELARRAGFPGRARAAGQVMATNLLPLILPCHRVVGHGGRLTGYSGGEGIKTKRWLLDFENCLMKNM